MPSYHARACLEQVLEQITDFSCSIQHSSDLETVLAIATVEARKLLKSDRVLVYQLLPGGDGVVLAESVEEGWQPIQGQLIYDPCFETKWHLPYQQGRVSAITDRETANLAPCYLELLVRLQVRANLVVPIVLQGHHQGQSAELWGLLIAHQCGSPRQWQDLDRQILQQLAVYLGFKIQNLNPTNANRQHALILSPNHPPQRTESQASTNSQTIPSPGSDQPESGNPFSLQLFDFLQTPVWVFDLDRLQMHWANRASLRLWNATNRDELLNRDFSDISEATGIRLQSYLQQFKQGKTLVEQWTFYPGGQPVSVQCRCSGIPIESDRLAMLVEGSIEMSHQMDQETLRSIEALRHTSVMISLYTWSGVPLLQNPAALRCYGDTARPNLATENIFLSHFINPVVGQQALVALEAGEVFSVETQVLTQLGIRWHGMDVRRVNDPVTGRSTILVNEKDITAQQQASSDRLKAEADLEAQRAFLRDVIDTVPSSIFVKDREGRCLVVNQASTQIHGSTVEMMVGKWEPDFNPNFDRAQLEEFLATNQAVMESRQSQQEVQQITTVTGEVRWYQTVIRPWIDAQGQVQGIIGNSVDITELKQVEAALRQKSERLAAIITMQQDIALNHPDQDAVMQLITEYAQELTHATGAVIELLEGDELVYRSVAGAAVSSAGLRLKAATSLSGYAIATSQILCCTDVNTDPRVDLEACHRVGVRSMVVVPLMASQSCVGVLKVFSQARHAFGEQDVQDLQLMAGFLTASIELAAAFEAKNSLLQALQKSEDRYRSVVNVMAEGVVLQQADGQITACNRSAETILGLTQDQMMGRTSIDPQWRAIHEDGSLFPGENHPAMVTLRTGKPQSGVVMGIHKPDDSLTWISINSQPLVYPGESYPYAVVTSFIDITTQKQAEANLHHLNNYLELQVQERTAQLQQALDFEALLKRITDKVRDSLDEQEILRSAVQELAQGLGILCCDTGIYNADQTTSTIAYEFSHSLSSAQGKTFMLADAPHPEIYESLLKGQFGQFCDVAPNPLRPSQQLLTVLACPLMDDQEVLGDLWLFKPSEAGFDEQEIRLVQQVANQCAIALRQSRLYRAAQTQVEELARLNQLKDDFLSTVSHELRTPMSSMTMAIQMLEVYLRPLGVFEIVGNPINNYFQILQTECQREISLINDLLDLTRLDSESDPLNLVPIHLQFWVEHVAEPFFQRAYNQEQELEISIPEDAPPLVTDLSYLERVLTELLHNACKYTPSGEKIAVAAHWVENNSQLMQIEVSNSGIEIPEIEYDRIFDKFYRIPNNDPWKHGGTGLGLSLVKKLVQRLGGTIWVESNNRLTRFIMQFPLSPDLCLPSTQSD